MVAIFSRYQVDVIAGIQSVREKIVQGKSALASFDVNRNQL